jgi:hypothetical protein
MLITTPLGLVGAMRRRHVRAMGTPLELASAGTHSVWIRLEPVCQLPSARRGAHLVRAFDAGH